MDIVQQITYKDMGQKMKLKYLLKNSFVNHYEKYNHKSNLFYVVKSGVLQGCIKFALERTRGNQTEAAKIVGIDRQTLRTYVKKHSDYLG